MWAIVNYNSCIGNCSVRGDILDFAVCHEKDSVGAGRAGFIVTLGQGPKFFSERGCPSVSENGILGKFFILPDGLSSDGMYNRVGKMFKMGYECLSLTIWEK